MPFVSGIEAKPSKSATSGSSSRHRCGILHGLRPGRGSLSCLVAAVFLVAPAAAPGQAQSGPVKQSQVKVRVLHSDMPALPGYYQLRMEHVQKQLELVPDQIDRLKALGKKYYEDLRADQKAWKNWRDMTPEQRTAKSAEIREKYTQRANELRKNIEGVLLPHQLKMLREINFRATGHSALSSPNTLKKLGVTEEQKQQLQEIRREMLEQYQELQKEAFEKSLKVLTPEQCEQLKEQVQARVH